MIGIVEEAYQIVSDRVKKELHLTDSDVERIAAEAAVLCQAKKPKLADGPVRLTIHHHEPSRHEKLIEWLGRIAFELCLYQAKKKYAHSDHAVAI
ncbi:hypothetical protein A3D54_01275 [Candidatus Falkowbacteria bacterium RIFCSPHIGHO2_02_FULL_45_15]|uniref:Uncharacterized protein n=1 Tax=Candidatus Falkowbacteria bacterium RIFCSPHIGHO2_02_FULL_45_15 TaxID=1797987 RepID=A0A1F5RNS9_9BACT|nr:MAG: hypothetical protein A3D54_01275 [Candidatus Falkowbacteria bacterium RIFCSPHIGHO2_02_FULL_45_15]